MSYTSPPRVKICGITSKQDAMNASEAGADAIGLVFYPPSPRNVSAEQAEAALDNIGPFTTTVGLFVNASADAIRTILRQVPLQVLQFHGDEEREFCEQFERPYIKALRMRPELDVLAAVKQYPSASAVLLDAYQAGVPGGTGATFDWQRMPQPGSIEQNIILAGGLTSANVALAIQQTTPYAVDVSGGVESVPGEKDPEKIAAFIQQAKGIV